VNKLFQIASPLLLTLALACGGVETGSGPDAADAQAEVSSAAESALHAPCAVSVDRASHVITVRAGAAEVPSPDLNADRPELSPDGRRVVFSTEDPTNLPLFMLSAYESQRDGRGAWSQPRVIKQSVGAAISGTLQSWFFPTYRPRGGGFLVGLGAVQTDATGFPDFATLDVSFLNLAADGSNRETVLSAAALGFPFGEIPEGQRYAPDGKRILFFAQSPGFQGLYLYDPAADVLTRLSDSLDKDPNFSADGRKIFFHNQVGDASQGIAETDTLGVITLEERHGAITSQRALLDAPAGAFAWAQHPALIQGSDVILYHRKNAAGDADNILAARRACDGATSFDVSIEIDGQPLVDAERPATALRARDAVFLGKFASDTRRRVFALPRGVVDRLEDIVGSSRCPRPGHSL
jgi:hypothetical protein